MRFCIAVFIILFSVAYPVDVSSITVDGNTFVNDGLILSVFGMSSGDEFNAFSIAKGTNALFDLGYFSDIEILADTADSFVEIVIRVSENRLLSSIEIIDPGCLSEADIVDTLSIYPGQTITPYDVERARSLILDLYAEKNHHAAEVVSFWREQDSDFRSALVFECTEGPDVRVGEIVFHGNIAFDDGKLRSKMDTKEDSFWRSGRFRESDFQVDLTNIEAFYHNSGYPEATITDVSKSMLDDGRHLLIEITVSEGTYFDFGTVTFEGNEEYSDSLLALVMDFSSTDNYSEEELGNSLTLLYEVFQERGYFYTTIEPVIEISSDSTALDIEFLISEGERAHVRKVTIGGNTRTLDNVIRREITVRPGDMFRRSALMRSYRNIYYLNYFQDVMVDFGYIDGSPDIDLIFNVLEKTTGKAGLGASYGGEDGFAGFLELAETNLFGRGLVLNLNYQFSKTKQDVQLGFTEPWVMDTPLSLGGELFHTTTNRDDYDRRRTGGAVTIGRPLPWFDYTRGSVRYMLEKVDVFDITSDTTSFYYSLNDIDWPRWTSSMRFNISRDNRDRQMFASSGSLNSLTMEFAGGGLGGDIGYQKYTLDTSWHIPAFWKFIYFLRFRGALIGSLAGEDPPAFELFELGGTGFFGVRGYPSRSIAAVEGYETVGGRTLMILSAEFRYRIIDQIQVSLFADAGNTWSSFAATDISNLYRGVGLGIRIEIPMLGVMGLDYAYGFDGPEPGWEPHFQFGTIF